MNLSSIVYCNRIPFPAGTVCPGDPSSPASTMPRSNPGFLSVPASPPPVFNKAGHITTAISTAFIVTLCAALICLLLIKAISLSRRGAQGVDRSSPPSPSGSVVVNMDGTQGSPTGGLDKSLLQKIRPAKYRRVARKAADIIKGSSTECAVCLSAFEHQDSVRLLPHCKHAFHVACIDQWFESHVNCPLCREDVAATCPATSMTWSGSVFDSHGASIPSGNDQHPTYCFHGFDDNVVSASMSPLHRDHEERGRVGNNGTVLGSTICYANCHNNDPISSSLNPHKDLVGSNSDTKPLMCSKKSTPRYTSYTILENSVYPAHAFLADMNASTSPQPLRRSFSAGSSCRSSLEFMLTTNERSHHQQRVHGYNQQKSPTNEHTLLINKNEHNERPYAMHTFSQCVELDGPRLLSRSKSSSFMPRLGLGQGPILSLLKQNKKEVT